MARREAPLVYIDTSQWVAFKKVLDQDKFGKGLARGLRKSLKEIGQIGVDAVKATLAEPTPGGNAPGDGLQAISDSVKTVVSFNKSAAGIRITASASGLPPEHKGLLNVYNTRVFKNPVEKTGKGRPYFGAVLYPTMIPEGVKQMRAALKVATDAIGARGN